MCDRIKDLQLLFCETGGNVDSVVLGGSVGGRGLGWAGKNPHPPPVGRLCGPLGLVLQVVQSQPLCGFAFPLGLCSFQMRLITAPPQPAVSTPTALLWLARMFPGMHSQTSLYLSVFKTRSKPHLLCCLFLYYLSQLTVTTSPFSERSPE